MNDYFEENKRSLILLTSLLFILALVLFFILVRPLMKDYKMEVNQIADLQAEIELLETKLKTLEQETPDEYNLDQLMLENKIPSERELDEYILTIQQLELQTKSKIEQINFTYDSVFETEAAPEEADEADQTEELEEELDEAVENDTNEEINEASGEKDNLQNEDEAAVDEVSEEEETSEPALDAKFLSELPENLYVMTVNIEVTSPNFDEFIELISLIESTERINIVTNLEFAKPTEADLYFADEPLEDISFSLEIATFYYMEDL